MTDNEIIKALECCKNDDCDNCPNDFGNCYANLSGYSLELINRQQEEIDRLRKEVNLVSIQFQDLQERYEEVQTEIEQWKEEANKYQKLWCTSVDDIETAKSEAYKEFAERLKDGAQMADCFDSYNMVVGTHFIDNLLKEMVGETDD